jgi:DNA (cytosine-5)-methyltransferase 1
MAMTTNGNSSDDPIQRWYDGKRQARDEAWRQWRDALADNERKPRLLDLFCGAGGAAMGYHRAGFEVVGVDIKPQPRYCGDEFHQGDAMTFDLNGYDAIHASPPCQAFSVMKSLHNARVHPDLIGPIRERLMAAGVPYVIENVPGAPLLDPIRLCGSMFDLRSSEERYLRRHRLFESNVPLTALKCDHKGLAVGVYGHGQAGLLGQRMRTAKAPEARVLMGMDWATRDGMSQAIPPAYTEHIGKQLMVEVQGRRYLTLVKLKQQAEDAGDTGD